MTNLQATVGKLDEATAAIQRYANKPTKAESARIRKLLGEIKNLVPPVRAELLAADRA